MYSLSLNKANTESAPPHLLARRGAPPPNIRDGNGSEVGGGTKFPGHPTTALNSSPLASSASGRSGSF